MWPLAAKPMLPVIAGRSERRRSDRYPERIERKRHTLDLISKDVAAGEGIKSPQEALVATNLTEN